MLEVDAYDHAQSLFGPSAAVWRVAPDRCLVGRWTSLGELAVPRVGANGAFSAGPTPIVLVTSRQGFVVLGEGATWALAFAAAEAFRIKHMKPSPRSASGRALAAAKPQGDALAPGVDAEAAQ